MKIITLVLLLFALSCSRPNGVYYEWTGITSDDVRVVNMYYISQKEENNTVTAARWILACENTRGEILEIDTPPWLYKEAFLGCAAFIMYNAQYMYTYQNNKIIERKIHKITIHHIGVNGHTTYDHR